MRRTTCLLAVATLLGVATPPAQAGAVITTGNVSLGVNDEGDLNFGGVGLRLAGVGDGIIPGCPCEGWGVAGNGISGWANRSYGGAFGLVLDGFASSASSATSNVHLSGLAGLTVSHAYSPSASPDLFQVDVTITNTTGAAISNILYRRVMDWDIPPTEFTEAVTVGGAPAANLLYVSDNGFASADPLSSRGFDIAGCGTGPGARFVDCDTADHGALFDFGFGDLAAGQSVQFSIFYGATFNEASAFAALGAVGAELYSFGQHDGDPVGGTPGTFIWGFRGVGGTSVVPEPATIAMLGSGLLVAGRRLRRRR